MAKILLTGFTPFDGREYNGSWIAAQWLADNHATPHHIKAALIPVIRGAPGEIISTWVRDWKPDLIISFGEGHAGQFAIETRARNQRKQRADNTGNLPTDQLIDHNGPAVYMASIDTRGLVATLANLGYPVQLSDDAGAFLCEELLYCLESARAAATPALPRVMFCHLPPFGSEFNMTDRADKEICDEVSLARFAENLLGALMTRYTL